uniref:Uncharacterized protein n=1 Tax=Hyaloperonospora arabidopsidis (strain Emoy2) TaxID=559515 RepID=M4C6B6_HYAAE
MNLNSNRSMWFALSVLLVTVFLLRSAVRGLSNYLMLANSSKDQRLHDAMHKKSPLAAENISTHENVSQFGSNHKFRTYQSHSVAMNRRALARKAAGAKAVAVAPHSLLQDQVGVENVTKKLQLHLETGDFYGALQMYKTLFMRYLKGDEPSVEQQEKAAALALNAALMFIDHDENTAAVEMANLMVSVFADFNHPVEEKHKQSVRQIASAFEQKPQFSADVTVFLKNAVKWSAAKGSRKRGDPELQLLLARAYCTAGDFPHAMKHFLHAENPEEMADALFQWSTRGYPSESDLYLARAVLQ